MKKLFIQLIIMLVSTLSLGQDKVEIRIAKTDWFIYEVINYGHFDFEGEVKIFDINKIDGTDYINQMNVYYDDVELISRFMKNYDYAKCYELEGKIFLKCSDGNSTTCDAKDKNCIAEIIEPCFQKLGCHIEGIYFP